MERNDHSPLARLTLYVMALCCASLLAWAHFAILDEVTVGTGKVVPSSQVQVIQNMEGGILAELHVREGDSVKAGQSLLRIDDTRFVSNYREGRARHLAIQAANVRLMAEANGKTPEFTLAMRREAPDVVKSELLLFNTRGTELDNSIANIQKSLNSAMQELEMNQPLLEKGAVSEVELLRLRRQASELQGQIDERRNRFRSEAQSEYNKNRAEMEVNHASSIAAQDRVTRTTVRAPIGGIVKRVMVTTTGGVIQPGEKIMEIVPVADRLLVEAKIRPSDIAFVHPGQQAMVKVSAYDYSIYGGLKGFVEQVSADAIDEERKDESYYKVLVRTERNALGTQEKPLPIIPGMTATVEVMTGHKSVLDYLLNPLLKIRESALRER